MPKHPYPVTEAVHNSARNCANAAMLAEVTVFQAATMLAAAAGIAETDGDHARRDECLALAKELRSRAIAYTDTVLDYARSRGVDVARDYDIGD